MTPLLKLFFAGGYVMWPILLASIITVAIAVERYRFYKKSRSNLMVLKAKLPILMHTGKTNEAKALCQKAGGLLGTALSEAIEKSHTSINIADYLDGSLTQAASRIRDNLNYLSAIVTLSPLLGLLGTVTGMINAFDVLSIADGQPFAITGGVAEALIATAFGLFVAILALMVHVWLSQMANQLITDIETGVNHFLASCKGS